MAASSSSENEARKKVKKERWEDAVKTLLGKHGLEDDARKMVKMYGIDSVRDFPKVLTEALLQKFSMTGTLQQYNAIYREARAAARAAGDESMPGWELYSEAELLRQEEIRVGRQGSRIAFCCICNCVKAECPDPLAHFSIFDRSPPNAVCRFCGSQYAGPSRFIKLEEHMEGMHRQPRHPVKHWTKWDPLTCVHVRLWKLKDFEERSIAVDPDEPLLDAVKVAVDDPEGWWKLPEAGLRAYLADNTPFELAELDARVSLRAVREKGGIHAIDGGWKPHDGQLKVYLFDYEEEDSSIYMRRKKNVLEAVETLEEWERLPHIGRCWVK